MDAALLELAGCSEAAGREPRLRETPEDICFEATANAIALHPARPLLAAGDVDGDVYLYSYSCTEGENRQLWSSGHHLKSCRDVAFSQDGQSECGGWQQGASFSPCPRTSPSMF
uniref:Uncharacterized protein n=1 Tax=Strix occidentalis caurina TaxID=311401 RepID=A0A8D0F7A8_STROC